MNNEEYEPYRKDQNMNNRLVNSKQRIVNNQLMILSIERWLIIWSQDHLGSGRQYGRTTFPE